MENKKAESNLDRRMITQLLSLFTGFIYGELDKRLDYRVALAKALKKPVPSHINFWFCFGGLSAFLVGINIITGIFLLMYYQPTVGQAYQSVVHITNNVPFGWLLRGLHHWSANLLMVTILIHMARVFFAGAYKAPRDLNWVVGVCLMLTALGFGFTGYLLPWNQIAYWATTVGTEIPGAVPYIGEFLKFLVRGGSDVTQLTLTRFFAVHVIILPWIISILLGLHFMMIRRLGISGPL